MAEYDTEIDKTIDKHGQVDQRIPTARDNN